MCLPVFLSLYLSVCLSGHSSIRPSTNLCMYGMYVSVLRLSAFDSHEKCECVVWWSFCLSGQPALRIYIFLIHVIQPLSLCSSVFLFGCFFWMSFSTLCCFAYVTDLLTGSHSQQNSDCSLSSSHAHADGRSNRHSLPRYKHAAGESQSVSQLSCCSPEGRPGDF